MSQHNNFCLWRPGPGTPRVFSVVGESTADLREVFDDVTVAARVTSPYAMPYETRDPIHVCRGLELPRAEAWRLGRHYI